MQTLGGKIKELRSKQGWSLDQLAQKSQVSKAYLSQLENGESERPSAEVLYNIAVSLGTSVAALLGKEIEIAAGASEIPANLKKAQVQFNILDPYLSRLAAIAQRTGTKKGSNDYSVEDWRYLYDTLQRIDDGKK